VLIIGFNVIHAVRAPIAAGLPTRPIKLCFQFELQDSSKLPGPMLHSGPIRRLKYPDLRQHQHGLLLLLLQGDYLPTRL